MKPPYTVAACLEGVETASDSRCQLGSDSVAKVVEAAGPEARGKYLMRYKLSGEGRYDSIRYYATRSKTKGGLVFSCCLLIYLFLSYL